MIRLLVLRGPVAFGLGLHLLEAFVVVGKLLQVGERDLPREDRVVAGDVGLRIMLSVLELHVQASPKLLEVNAIPIDADLVADSTSLFARCALGFTHSLPPRGCLGEA